MACEDSDSDFCPEPEGGDTDSDFDLGLCRPAVIQYKMPASRSRRNQPPRESPVSATVSRASSGSPVDNKKSLRLTVKAPSSKLRQATSRGTSSQRDELPRNARSSRPKKPIVDESEMDDDEDEEEDDEEEEDDDDEEEEEEDAEGEDDDEMDVDAEADSDDDPVSSAPGPARPVISRTGPAAHPKVTVTPALTSTRPAPVEAKEAALASKITLSPSAEATSDEELSELDDEDAEGEDEELDGEGEEEDAEGEEVEDEEEDEDMGDGSDDDDDDDEEDTGQGTPDVSKMTKRQRERLAGGLDDGAFLQLPMEPQIKKHLTAEEHAMRRAEMARRRKNLSEKRNEEEKRDTINRLLKKQAPKRRGKVSRQEEAEADGDQDDDPDEKPDRLFVRWINDRNGSRLAVPAEWEGKEVAGVLAAGMPSPWNGPKVQVVEES